MLWLNSGCDHPADASVLRVVHLDDIAPKRAAQELRKTACREGGHTAIMEWPWNNSRWGRSKVQYHSNGWAAMQSWGRADRGNSGSHCVKLLPNPARTRARRCSIPLIAMQFKPSALLAAIAGSWLASSSLVAGQLVINTP
ncbi:hypothetical protein FKP32DRAFT_1587891 [Trametes sanguinea]|nr:hypothetical protein FKP32DRAFT_1587891 [Trametes sanguinea]